MFQTHTDSFTIGKLDLVERNFTKKNLVIFYSFSVLLSHTLLNQHTSLRLKYINSTRFLSQIISKLTCQVVSLSKWKYFVNSRTLHKWGGGLNREEGLFQILAKKEGLIREGA